MMSAELPNVSRPRTPPLIADVAVVIPTVGRSQLQGCLESIAKGNAWPAELIVVDQGSDLRVAAWIEELRAKGMTTRHIRSSQTGTAAATNRGLESVRTPFVAVTHDDCRVEPNWLRCIADCMREAPGAIVTGMVRPEKGTVVPSVITSSEPAVYHRPLLDRDPLFPANMAFSLDIPRRIGPFDECSPLLQAEDAEWSYRALRAGVPIIYVPEAEVRHTAWRDARQRAATYRGYARSLGGFYGTYIRKGDLFMLLRLVYDLLRGPWIVFRALATGDRELAEIGRAYVTHLLPGVLAGLRYRRSL